MNKRIKYLCYYDLPDATIRRNYVLAATNKLDYIWSVLNRSGYSVDVISACSTNESEFCYLKGEFRHFDSNNTLRLFPCFGGPKVIRVLGRFYLWICLSVWFLLNVRKDEIVFVYHSLGYCRLVLFLQRIVKCRILGEIEEIYQDVSPQSNTLSKAEYSFFKICYGYLFPTHLLNQKLNTTNKPYILIHGIYSIETFRNLKWDDNDIHVVYAGTFDPNKGGAEAAIMAASYLPKCYHVHICGFGSVYDTDNVKKAIQTINETSEATVSFDGLLQGEDFVTFLQKCHIGLSTQNPNAAFNASSFPSKILTYLSNGLHVVTIRIPAVEFSDIGMCVSYYNHQTPEEIAKAIVSVPLHKSREATSVLQKLDSSFECSLVNLLMQ